MKNILIDLGSHKFEGLKKLLSENIINHTFDVYCYEANPNIPVVQQEFYFKSFQLFREAVSDFDGEVSFNLDETNTSQGCNILKQPPLEDVLWKTKYQWKTINVPCVSVDTVLARCNIAENDNLYIKCDIEGAEFDVLLMILKSPYIFNIRRLFVEWHDRFWYPDHLEKQNQKQQIINMFNMVDIKVENWE